MKTGMVLLGTLIVTCSVTLVSGRKPNPVPARDAQDYGCAMLSVNVPPRARPVGVVQIPSPAANFIAIGHLASNRWHRFWGEPLDHQDCVWSADSAER
jgi:hypothetical protein